MIRPRATLVVLIALASSAQARGAAMPSYTVTDLGGMNTFSYREFYGLNDLGQVLGMRGGDQLLYTGGKLANLGQSVRLIATNSRGEILEQTPGNGALTDTEVPTFAIRGPDGSTRPIEGLLPHDTPEAINDRGQILVTNDYTGDDSTRGLAVLTDGNRRAFPPLPGGMQFAYRAFGPNGEVSGVARFPDSDHGSGYLRPDGPTPFGHDNGDNVVIAFNNSGQSIAAPYDTGRYGFGTVYSSKAPLSLRFSPSALNDAGQIVGGYGVATLLSDGLTIDLNTALATKFAGTLTRATAINNLGQILAVGTIDDGLHTFLLAPQAVPEPSSWLVVSGLLAGALVLKSRRRSRPE